MSFYLTVESTMMDSGMFRVPFDDQYDYERFLSDNIPAEKGVFYVDPDYVFTTSKDGYDAVVTLRNCFGPSYNAPGILPRNVSHTGDKFPVVDAFANGVTAFRLPALGTSTSAEPFQPTVPLDPNAHSFWGFSKISAAGTAGIIGLTGATLGVGVHLQKLTTSSGNLLRWYWKSTTDYLQSSTSILNTGVYWMLTFSVANGRKLYLNGTLVDHNDAATDVATTLTYQLFAEGTGGGPASGKCGIKAAVNMGLSDAANAALKARIDTYMLTRYAGA